MIPGIPGLDMSGLSGGLNASSSAASRSKSGDITVGGLTLGARDETASIIKYAIIAVVGIMVIKAMMK